MLSPLIGVVVGALVTLVLIILVVVVRVRRERVSKPRHEKPAELSELPPQQYPLQNPQQTVETDPDVIPNKFGEFLKIWKHGASNAVSSLAKRCATDRWPCHAAPRRSAFSNNGQETFSQRAVNLIAWVTSIAAICNSSVYRFY